MSEAKLSNEYTSATFESKYCLPKHPPGMMLEFFGPYLLEHAKRITITNHQTLKLLIENEWNDYAASGKVRAVRKKPADDGDISPESPSANTGASTSDSNMGTSSERPSANAGAAKPEHVIILHQKIGMLRSLIKSLVSDPEVRNELIQCVSTLV